jgi:hypothetical protein
MLGDYIAETPSTTNHLNIDPRSRLTKARRGAD